MNIDSDVFLCQVVDIDNIYQNTIDFENIQSQHHYFTSRVGISVSEISYIRKESVIKVPYLVDDIFKYNYLFYVNNNKTYYCFINEMEYISDSATAIHFEIDVMQTFMFDYSLGQCYVDRCHVDRWVDPSTPIKNLLDEGLTTNDYTQIDKIKLYEYRDAYLIVSSVPLGNLGNSVSGGTGGTIIPPKDMPSNPKLSGDNLAFVQSIYNGAIQGYTQYRVFPSVTIAQAILESGWGKSGLAKQCNNLFGIKADSSWTGEKRLWTTTEYRPDGSSYETKAWFRVYPSKDASVLDHAKFLKDNSRYTQAGVFNATTANEQIRCIANAGYATDPSYANQVIEVMRDSNLYIYD